MWWLGANKLTRHSQALNCNLNIQLYVLCKLSISFLEDTKNAGKLHD